MISAPVAWFSHLRQGMTLLLGLSRGKMIVGPVLRVPAVVSLGVIVVIIAAGAAASPRQCSRRIRCAARGACPDGPRTPPARVNARRSTA